MSRYSLLFLEATDRIGTIIDTRHVCGQERSPMVPVLRLLYGIGEVVISVPQLETNTHKYSNSKSGQALVCMIMF